MSSMPRIRSHQQPAVNPARLLVLIVILLLVFVTAAHLLGLSAELILLLLTAVTGAAIKLVKALPRLQPQVVL